MTINLESIHIAIVENGSKSLGRSYDQYNYLVYVRGNPDDTTYDNVSSRTSAQWRSEIAKMLPKGNAGCSLGAFTKVEGCRYIYVAEAYIKIDSGD